VLVLNLPARDDTPSGRMLASLARAGQPAVLTLRQLVGDAPGWRLAQPPVFVCENPAVVATAADRLGAGCRPLICTDGQPSAACSSLLHSLLQAGGEPLYHGDFDWPGITIANGVFGRFGMRPWRFDSSAYRAAPYSGKALAGAPVQASWEPELTAAMQQRGMTVEEELVLEDLLHDLAG
jgi:uncharacterized protein (TIGR02679 family)